MTKRNFIIRETVYAIACLFMVWVIITQVEGFFLTTLSIVAILTIMLTAYKKGQAAGPSLRRIRS